MSYKDGRDGVVDTLRSEISKNIRRSNVDRADCYNIAMTCLNYEGGIEELIAGIGFFEGNSFAMKRLLALVGDDPP